jgi:large subunit ribosomal protein L10
MDKQNNLAKKKDFVQSLSTTLTGASSVVLIDPSGMTVQVQQELKKRLKEAGSTLTVVKNTLIKLAGKEAKLDEKTLTDDVLAGPTALVLGTTDPIAPLQVLAKFAGEFQIPNMKAGIVEGTFQDKEALITLSKLPGKDQLYAQVVGGVGAPLYGLVGTLQGNLQKLVYILEQAASRT